MNFKKIALVVSAFGYHWEEVVKAYIEFEKAGFEISFFSTKEGPPNPDPTTIRKTGVLSLFGLGTPAGIAPDTTVGKRISKQLETTKPIATLDTDQVDAIFLAGGHGCLFDLNRDPVLHRKIEALYSRGAPLGAVCHATSTFSFVKKQGKSIVQGKKLTGFPDAIDVALVKFKVVPKEFLPIPLSNDHELSQAGAKVSAVHRILAILNPAYTRTDYPFFTGIGPKASAKTARNLIGAISNRA